MAKTHSTTEIPMGKVVRWNRENKDFDFFYDREYLGSRATEQDARECVNEYAYDLARGYIATPALAADPLPFPETVAVNVAPVVDEEDAAFDAANRQKVFDAITTAMGDKTQSLFVDTLPGRINGTPIDLVVCFSIGAAIERNKAALGITQDQVYAILHHISEVCEQYLETPRRKMQLLWDGM